MVNTTTTTTTTVIDPLYLSSFLSYKKENGKCRTFSRVLKLQNGSHQLFYISFSLRSKRFRLVSGAERDFRFFFVLCSEIAPKRLLRRLHFLFSPLFWLVDGFCFGDSRLPSNKCYQRGRFTLGQWCPVSHPASPGWSWFFTVVYSFLDSLLRVSHSLLNSFLLTGKASLVSISGAVLFLWA